MAGDGLENNFRAPLIPWPFSPFEFPHYSFPVFSFLNLQACATTSRGLVVLGFLFLLCTLYWCGVQVCVCVWAHVGSEETSSVNQLSVEVASLQQARAYRQGWSCWPGHSGASLHLQGWNYRWTGSPTQRCMCISGDLNSASYT